MNQLVSGDFQFSEDQQRAMDRLVDWWHDHDEQQVFRLFGYAGTGKTTCVSSMMQAINIGPNDVCSAAFTGKAALVMTRKGTPATTIHKLIYSLQLPDPIVAKEMRKKIDNELDKGKRKELESELKQYVKPRFALNDHSRLAKSKLLLLDECSMVGADLGCDLLSFGVPILVVGDPGQLPPIEGAGFFTDSAPDAMLEQIHRQALDSPIIDLATRAREGRPFPSLSRSTLTEAVLTSADMILCGTNKTRKTINSQLRNIYGRGHDPLPLPGDRLCCWRNDYGLQSSKNIDGPHDPRGVVVLNGELVTVLARGNETDIYVELLIENDDGQEIEVRAIKSYFLGQDLPDYWNIEGMQHFDFGYCLTVHKSQGSQWPNIVFIDDNFGVWDKPMRRRWLYTAITRAEEKLEIYR